jgi:hypothetical protein
MPDPGVISAATFATAAPARSISAMPGIPAAIVARSHRLISSGVRSSIKGILERYPMVIVTPTG